MQRPWLATGKGLNEVGRCVCSESRLGRVQSCSTVLRATLAILGQGLVGGAAAS